MIEGDRAGQGAPTEHAKVTSLRDVAHAAGVSVSTASRVLSGSAHPVSQVTRQAVMEAADRLGFEPNRLARALATARSQTIGVVVHDVADPYFAGIVRGLEDVAGPRDHALFVSSSDRDPDKELSLVRAFISHRVDAIVLAASGLITSGYLSQLAPLLSRFEALGGVVVALSEHGYEAARVVFDNRRAVRMVVDHLIGLGHRSIAYLDGPQELEVNHVRFEGYRDALAGAGIEFDRSLVEAGGFRMDTGARATEALLNRVAPTAIVAANDLMAIGAMRTLLDRGLSIPGEMSVAGFDDIEFAAYASVPLTTGRIPLAELGRRAAELVFDLLGGQSPDRPPTIEPELVVRQSTGPVPA